MDESSLKINNLSSEVLLELVQSLHASLDLSQILETFYLSLNKLKLINSLVYDGKSLPHEICFGQVAEHSFNYELTINNQELGEVTFSKKIPFSNTDILQIEELICLLITPLNNAIKHYEALQTAIHDPLTNLLNRVSLDDHLTHEISSAVRHELDFSVLLIDIDNFKEINDIYGHLIGDKILIHFAKILKDTIREADIAFRIGGDEFLILLNNTDYNGALTLAKRLHESIISNKLKEKDKELILSISIGIAMLESGQSSKSLIDCADKALYKAKKSGKNKVVLYPN